MINIIECDDYEAAKNLILDYSKIKGAEACFVSLDKELSDLKGFYKGGALLLGYENEKPIATIAIKKINDDMAEAKRLYIKPEYRGKGYARQMLDAMLDKCRELKYKEVRFVFPLVLTVKSASENYHMKMRMIVKPGTPCVQDADVSDLCTEVFRILR